MLSVSNLSVSFDENHVLDGFNLDLQSGDIFALLGDSGSGKSSALRFIAGLESASNGRVALDGNNLSLDGNHSVKPELREIGMVFQDYALFPHMTVFQNISFGIDYLSKKDKIERVQTLLELISLQGIEKKYPHQLSGGEQQRVSLARSLATSPKLLLLDEPFSSLDKSHRDQLVQEVRVILKNAGVTSILVTHDESEAEAFADRVGIIHKKKLLIK
ncbi:ABC transporter ATP-binding protein [Candidatus Thioglobus sp.]|jgi:iron(III) transport system ATP-binding protein|uniref:ABC transporter ATP-binding protein n=1 Tax=unclassified Candidatus Pseudothioglobus TaxID=3072908 RepID=UPI00236BCE1B|nr:ABC transporter ATP-binding protein [Candidatus Thioglobus sp.]MDB9865405.1 ABC transporter ATP-binding protein [Candidatus Thioglobus sp.]|tara:strand:+ start:24 stop:674 length:651 start_codon:yes stop_codon:yes gene_type:complete